MSSLPPWVRNPDNYSCGAASTLWALRYLGHTERLSVKRLAKDLHVKDVPWWLRAVTYVTDYTEKDMMGAVPSGIVRVMYSYGHLVIRPGLGNYFNKVLSRGRVCITGYSCETPYGDEDHWVAVARDSRGYLAVMDPDRGLVKGARAQKHNCFKDTSSRTILGFEP